MRHDKWDANIREAKTLVKNAHMSQMLVAKLALECCEIQRGGNHADDRYTLKRFANEIGVSDRTLHSWVTVRKNVFDKVDDSLKMTTAYSTLYEVASQVPANASTHEVTKLFHETITRSGSERKLLGYLEVMRTIYNNLNKDDAPHRFSKELLEETHHYANLIKARLSGLGFKAEDHKLLSTLQNKHLSELAEKDLDKSGGVLSFNDRAVVEKLKEAEDFVSPTVIGRELFPQKTKLASKLTVLRSLQKLKYFNKVVSNNKGHYKLKGENYET